MQIISSYTCRSRYTCQLLSVYVLVDLHVPVLSSCEIHVHVQNDESSESSSGGVQYGGDVMCVILT